MTSSSPGQAPSDEVIARAICDSLPYGHRGGYHSDHRQHTIAGDPEWHLHRDGAVKVVAALEAAGYAVVPLEPTAEMIAATDPEYAPRDAHAIKIYRAMLAARPR